MIQRTSPFRRWAHLSLLVAALLQFAGAAAGPWAHDYGRVSSGHTLCAPDRHGQHAPATHNELACWAWQTFASVAPPASGAALVLIPGTAVEAVPVPRQTFPSLPVAPSRARAPPVS